MPWRRKRKPVMYLISVRRFKCVKSLQSSAGRIYFSRHILSRRPRSWFYNHTDRRVFLPADEGCKRFAGIYICPRRFLPTVISFDTQRTSFSLAFVIIRKKYITKETSILL